jgi:hypothetical protein
MSMRLVMSGIVIASVMGLAAGSVQAQAGAQPKQFGGLKLVDPQNPRGLETDISVRVDTDHLILIDPHSKKEVRSLPYSSIKGIDDTFSITPPLPAGTISGASTGGASMPSYMGRESRHWWTINTDSGAVILRVSPQVYDQLKAGVAEHNVKIQESPAKKKK